MTEMSTLTSKFTFYPFFDTCLPLQCTATVIQHSDIYEYLRDIAQCTACQLENASSRSITEVKRRCALPVLNRNRNKHVLLSTQAWNQADWHFIASQLGSLGLEPVLTCPGDEAWGLAEDQSRAGGAGKWDPTKMEPSPNSIAVFARSLH